MFPADRRDAFPSFRECSDQINICHPGVASYLRRDPIHHVTKGQRRSCYVLYTTSTQLYTLLQPHSSFMQYCSLAVRSRIEREAAIFLTITPPLKHSPLSSQIHGYLLDIISPRSVSTSITRRFAFFSALSGQIVRKRRNDLLAREREKKKAEKEGKKETHPGPHVRGG